LSTPYTRRDIFLGNECCIVCGFYVTVKDCHIVGKEIWSDLRRRGWVPSQTAEEPQDELRNRLILCTNHFLGLSGYEFFIRFFPDIQKFVFVNHYDRPKYRKYHGKAVAFDIKDPLVPFPSLFIIHEIRARESHPFEPVGSLDVPGDSRWQDWISLEEVFDDVSQSFRRNLPRSSVTPEPSHQLLPAAGGMSSGARKLELNENVIADIVAATRAMPSWKACQEGL